LDNYVLFTGQNCNPCETVKSMLAQSSLPEGTSLEIVDASIDTRVIDYVVRSVPTLVNVETKEQTTGVFNIVKKLNRA
jgi:hypothetical protein